MRNESVFLVIASDQAVNIATQGYGVANWYFVNDEEEKAREILDKVLEGKYWSAFGYIAAEADVARLDSEGGSN